MVSTCKTNAIAKFLKMLALEHHRSAITVRIREVRDLFESVGELCLRRKSNWTVGIVVLG